MSQTLEANKKVVLESHNLALNKKDADAAFKFLGPTAQSDGRGRLRGLARYDWLAQD